MLLIPDDATSEWTFENRGAYRWVTWGRFASTHGKETGKEESPLNAAILTIVLQASGNSSARSTTWSLDPGLLVELCEAYFAIADAYVSFLTTKVANLCRHQQRL